MCTTAFLAACSPVRGGEEPSFSALSYKNLIPNESYSPATVPLAPGTALDLSGDEPRPGAYFNYQSCTAAWSFTLADARTIAVTASHCGKPGDKVWAGTADGDFSYPAEPIGEVIYSDFYSEDSHDLDVAFIEITGSAEYYVPGAVDNSVATSLAHLPHQVCKLGRVTDETCGTLSHDAEMAQLNSEGLQRDSLAARAHVCSTNGDSGGPVYGEVEGKQTIVGVVSGTTQRLEEGHTCQTTPTDMELSFTLATDIQLLAKEVLGPMA
ncbi:trypsin-like serine protease [Corynebacterium marquesiae]|uniref:trypsin-like serine protease n=1 Tax=Corynebacterium marquesiae TaxID=2913503 RepID=UPI00254E72D5|nr:trypsin-like serine protease [Corynebacterium marquesiae]MDK8495762.1 trypsin-like serine protease [Corynebacterium marquesiae]